MSVTEAAQRISCSGAPALTEERHGTTPFGAGRTAWIISYTPVVKEPRVVRQAMALRDSGWRVVVFGLNGPASCPVWWHHVSLPESPEREQPDGRLLRLVCLLRQYNRLLLLRASQALACAPGSVCLRQLAARVHQSRVEAFECKRRIIRDYADEVAREHPDQGPALVLSHDYFTADIAWQLAQRFQARMVIDCHEYAPGQYMQDPRWVRWHRPRVLALQQYYLSRADATTTVCEGIAGLLDAEYPLRRPVRVVRSMPFYSEQPFRPAGDMLTVMYHGEIYASRGLHFAVRSMPLWRSEFRLVLRGYSDPSYVEDLWQIAHDLGVADRLSIEAPVAFHDIIPVANRADIGYFVHQDISPQRRFVLPNKFFEYVMAGLALCVSDLPEMARLVDRYDLGLLVPECREQTIANVINSFNRQRIDACKQRSLAAARELNWEAERAQMLSLYEELLS